MARPDKQRQAKKADRNKKGGKMSCGHSFAQFKLCSLCKVKHCTICGCKPPSPIIMAEQPQKRDGVIIIDLTGPDDLPKNFLGHPFIKTSGKRPEA